MEQTVEVCINNALNRIETHSADEYLLKIIILRL